jgi:TP901 family phage tail tape measure protein
VAGPKGDINANVGLNISDGGITKVFADLETKIDAALNKIIKLGDVAAGSGGKLTQAAAKELGNVDIQVKTLQRSIQQLDTIAKAMSRATKNNVAGVLGTGLDDVKIAKSVKAVNDFKRSLDEAQGPAEKLRARINAITTETANLAREGKAQTDGRLRQQEQLSVALKQYEALSVRLSASTSKIGSLNPENQKQMQNLVLEAQRLKEVFGQVAGDGRQFKFTTMTEAMKNITLDIDKQVAGLAQQERLEQRLLVNTRERGQAMLDISSRQRQINLEQQSASKIGRLTPTQTSFSSAVGEQGLDNRLARATNAYTAAKRQLETALSSGSGASDAQIAKLIQQLGYFDNKIVETIALQGRMSADFLRDGKIEEATIDRVAAAQDKLNRTMQQAVVKDISAGIKSNEAALKDFDRQIGVVVADEKRLEQQTDSLAAANERLARMLRQDVTKNGSRAITDSERAMRDFDKQIGVVINDEKRLEQQTDKTAMAQDRYNKLIAQLRQKEVTTAIRDSEKALKDFEKELANTGNSDKLSPLKKAFDGLLGDGGAGLIARVGIYSLAAGAIYNVIGALKDGAKFAVEFEDKLANLQAISGSTKTQMADLSGTILDVGKNSKFSILDIADATLQLAQAGFTVGQTKEALGAVSDFAAASGTSVSDSVNLITQALGSFQLQASETTRITDVFTAALNRSKLTSTQIAQALQYVGTTAFEQNISLETLVATIGAVAQSGVRAGSTLGTGFRQFLVDLANPSEKLQAELGKLGISLGQVDVKSRGLSAVLNTLKDAGFGAAQAYAGLEVRAAAFFLAAKNNLDVTAQLELAESQRGVAAEAASRAMDSLSAQTQRFYNILGQLAVDNAPLDFFKELVKDAADLAEKIGATAEEYKQLKALQKEPDGLEEGLESQLVYYYKLANEYQNVETALYKLVTTGSIYTKSAAEQGAASDALATKTSEAADAATQQAQKINEVQGEFAKLLLQGPDIRDNTIQTSIVTNNLTSRFEGLASQLGTTANGYDNLVIAMKKYNAQQLVILGQQSAKEAAAGRNQFTALSGQANGQIANIRQSAGYRGLTGGQRGQLENLIQNSGKDGGLNALNDFITGLKGASPALNDLRTKANGLVVTLGNRLATRSQVQAADRVSKDANIQANPIYRGVADSLIDLNGQIGKALTAGAGQTADQRRSSFAPIINSLDRYAARVDTLIVANKGNENATRNLLGLKADIASARNQAVGSSKPTDKENKASVAAGKKAETERKANERAAQRATDTFNKNELTVSQSQLKAADKALGAFLSGQNQNFGLKDITQLFSDGDKALNEWITARQAVLADAIQKSGLNKQQAADLTDAANTEIEAKQKSTIQRQVEILDRAVSGLLERRARQIETQYKNNLDPQQSNLGIQSGLSAGLDNPLLQGVPGYTKVLQKRQVDLAQDKLNRAQIGERGANGLFTGGENEKRIEEYQTNIDQILEKYEELSAARDMALAGGDKNKVQAAAYKEEMDRLSITLSDQRDKVLGLTQANETLRAQYSAADLKPQTFGQAASQAADAFRIQNDIGITLKERLFGGLGDTLNSLHGSFSSFFEDLVTGSKSVGQAFGDMATAVVKAILNMAAQAVATQIFGLLLSFIPSAGPSGGVSASQGLSNFQFKAPGFFQGGRIGDKSPQRLAGGGAVRGGVSTRDSVLVHAAKGEFMMKNSSVESIGHDLLQDMNNRGAAALGKLGGSNITVPQSSFRSNVYVQLPEEKTQLGPNDVLAIVSRDVLRGGATKQLIKQVSSGG